MFLFYLLSSVGTVIDGRCSTCLLLGVRSVVYSGVCVSTLAAAIGYYDEDGKYHYEDPNVTTCSYRCSRGHDLVTRSGGLSKK